MQTLKIKKKIKKGKMELKILNRDVQIWLSLADTYAVSFGT